MSDRQPADTDSSVSQAADESADEPTGADRVPSLSSPFWHLDAALIGAGALLLVVHWLAVGGALVSGDVAAIGQIGTYAFLVGSSSPVVAAGLRHFTGDALQGGGDIDEDTGWLIGKLENVLVVTFVFQDAFTALSIVFAAKSFIRREDTASGNTTYYVAGTLLNFTYSVVVGLVAVRTLGL